MFVVFFGWFLFRAREFEVFSVMLHSLSNWDWGAGAVGLWSVFLLSLVPLVVIEAWQSVSGDLLAPVRVGKWLRATLQAALIIAIVLSAGGRSAPFIYFQF